MHNAALTDDLEGERDDASLRAISWIESDKASFIADTV